MACPHCGSWSVRADRSLAGRMVCGRCGRPLQGMQRGAAGPLRQLRRPGRWRWWLLALIVAAATLAALAPGSRQFPFRDGSGDRPHDRWQ